jgi:hypothetical protein
VEKPHTEPLCDTTSALTTPVKAEGAGADAAVIPSIVSRYPSVDARACAYVTGEEDD